MPEARTTKEKILAVFFVFFLFLMVGYLLGQISLNNKRHNDALRAEVRRQNNLLENKEKLDKISLNITATTSAKSFLILARSSLGQEKILSEKGSNLVVPIASLSKLMTAVIVKQNIDLKTQITATKDYVGGDGTAKVLEIGKTYSAEALLSNMLISSDNDSAQLLASALGTENFVTLMNHQAQKLGLTRTHFVNVTGLDPLLADNNFNTSNARDLAKLLIFINETYPELLKITRSPEYNFCDNANNCRLVTSTNKLLENKDLQFKIIGGKTGQTVLANKNLALISQTEEGIQIISLVLGSDDNFTDTLKIINQIKIKK